MVLLNTSLGEFSAELNQPGLATDLPLQTGRTVPDASPALVHQPWPKFSPEDEESMRFGVLALLASSSDKSFPLGLSLPVGWGVEGG